MRQATFTILFFLAGWASRAQFVFVPGTTHDFGNVDTWHNDPAHFRLVNTGAKPLAILRLTGNKNILAEYPKTYIQPGDTGLVVLRYYTPAEGPFSENVEVMLSASDRPVQLTVKGRIRTIAADALTACPGGQLQGTPPNFSQNFTVLDSRTGKIIPGAQFFVGTQGQSVDRFRIPVPGRAVNKTYRSGMYVLQISADGYSTVDTGIVILAGVRNFTFYLDRPLREEIPVAAVPEPERPQTPASPPPLPPPARPAETEPVAAAVADSLDTNPVLPLSRFRPNNIVFVLDVSSSMRILGRMDMLKEAMLRLTEVLRRADRVSIITFTTSPVTRIQGVDGSRKDTLSAIIRSFTASGATNGIRGLRYAYELAERHFIRDGNNMVIIGTDGVFAQTDENGVGIGALVEEYLAKNIKLGVMAFGRDAEAIRSMEKTAARGQGGFMRMDDPAKAPALLLEQIRVQSARP